MQCPMCVCVYVYCVCDVCVALGCHQPALPHCNCDDKRPQITHVSHNQMCVQNIFNFPELVPPITCTCVCVSWGLRVSNPITSICIPPAPVWVPLHCTLALPLARIHPLAMGHWVARWTQWTVWAWPRGMGGLMEVGYQQWYGSWAAGLHE